jgi:phosphoribosylamine-glycine ligase
LNILIYSLCGEGAMLVESLRKEGHEPIVYIKNGDSRSIGDGVFWKTTDPDGIVEQADIVLFDDNGMGAKADEYRKAGHRVWNGGQIHDKLEYDRLFGVKVMREHGLALPKTFEVSSLDDVARAALDLKESKKLVVKIDGQDAAGTSFSFVADDAEQLQAQVQHWEDDGLLPSGWSGIVQEFVDGIEVSVEGWFNGESWSDDYNITLEEKRPFAGGLGPNIGCAYNTIFPIKKSSGLVTKCLDPLTEFLRSEGFVGQIDVNNIVGQDGVPYALEFTPRCGYDATPTLAFGWGYGWRLARAFGLDFETPEPRGGRFAGGVRVYVPPYPVELDDADAVEKACGNVKVERPEALRDLFYEYDTKRTEEGLVCAGTCGIIGVAHGMGDSPREAGLAAYRTAERIKVPGKSYRAIDGWKRGESVVHELISLGLIRLPT